MFHDGSSLACAASVRRRAKLGVAMDLVLAPIRLRKSPEALCCCRVLLFAVEASWDFDGQPNRDTIRGTSFVVFASLIDLYPLVRLLLPISPT